MLQLFDRNYRKIAILENAYQIQEEQSINAVNYLSFTLPDTDPKNELCESFYFVRYKDGDLYRIMAPERTLSETGDYTYKSEHVFAMLIDDLIENDVQSGGRTVFTADVIREVLSHQLTPNWRLGECDFRYEFEYGWTDESVLAALHSIPNRFVEPYIWTFDTHVHPFVLNLKRLDMDKYPEMYIRAGKNALQMQYDTDATTVVTRLYPRGDGEGINTLTIEAANGGVPFIQSPSEIIAKYGIISRPWRDKRYTNAQSLLDAGRAMLHELQTPFEQYEVDFAVLGEDDFHTPALGKVVEVVGFKKTVITKIVWDHDEIPNSSLSIANKPRDVAGAISDLANRQRIEATYAQGATQIYADSIADNADATTPATIRFRLPRNLAIINEVVLTVNMSRFRAYGVATGLASAGAGTYTASNNPGLGASQQHMPDNGINMTRTALLPEHIWDRSLAHGPGQANHNHGIADRWIFTQRRGTGLPASGQPLLREHLETVWWEPSGAHEHQAHGHGYNIPSHQHSFTIPNHTHQVDARISFLGFARNFRVEINGQFITNPETGGQWFTTSDREFDLVPHLFDENNNLRRGIWHTINIHPDDFARIEMSYYVQGFIRSEGSRAV